MRTPVILEEPIRRHYQAPESDLLVVAKEVVQRLLDAGHEAYLVGGSIRDMVLEDTPKDYDIATSALPKQVQKLFKKNVPVGIQFGTVMVLRRGYSYEVTTFRADGRYVDGRRPTEVIFATVVEDVERRDFTINGLLYNAETEEVIDYVGGLEDLDAKIIRTIGDPFERFGEDRLRMLRAVRFASRLSFALEDDTMKAIQQMAPRIHEVSGERIQQELMKILQGANPRRGVALLAETGLLKELLPAMEDVQACLHRMERLEHHTERDETLSLAMLLFDLSRDDAEDFLQRYRFSNDHTKGTLTLLEQHPQLATFSEKSIAEQKKLVRQPYAHNLLLLGIDIATLQETPLESLHDMQRKLTNWTKDDLRPTPLFNGNDLKTWGYQPGPHFKEIIFALEVAQLEGHLTELTQAKQWLQKHFPKEV